MCAFDRDTHLRRKREIKDFRVWAVRGKVAECKYMYKKTLGGEIRAEHEHMCLFNVGAGKSVDVCL